MKPTKTNQLLVWRDSVSAGDDCDAPHELVLPLRDESLRSFASRLLGESYLASIASGRATWILQTDRQAGRSLAVVAQQWSQPRFLVDPESPVSSYIQRDSTPHLYFRYWCQVDPERVARCLQHGEPLPDKYGRDDTNETPNQ
ncbi:MAG TPA: hypothetical protein VKE29_00290 [Candidatus Udaeobacter sp.]|nr:hypothetical protein [Candidatus Udaeobacter sp.]